jgi:hypothetical protein
MRNQKTLFATQGNKVIMYKSNSDNTDYDPFKCITLKGRTKVTKNDFRVAKEILQLMPDASGGHDVEPHQSLDRGLQILKHPYNKDGYIHLYLMNNEDLDIGQYIINSRIDNSLNNIDDVVNHLLSNKMYLLDEDTGRIYLTLEGDRIISIVGDDVYHMLCDKVRPHIKTSYEVRICPDNVQGNHKAWSTLLGEYASRKEAEDSVDNAEYGGNRMYIEKVYFMN